MTRFAQFIIFIFVLGVLPCQAKTLRVGANETYKMPSEAAEVAQNGDHIQIEPGEYFDCAVWRADNLVIEGIGPGVVIRDKACWERAFQMFIAAENTTVRNLTLTRARVPDNNGAGIRLDKGNLVVDRVKFIDNQNGILASPPGVTITITNSDFEKNGVCAAACAHAIYVGEAKLLRVEHSRFRATRQGHSIKSRALRTEVIGCDIGDGPDGTSSYLIDISNGGAVVVRDNILGGARGREESHRRDRHRRRGRHPSHARAYHRQQHIPE